MPTHARLFGASNHRRSRPTNANPCEDDSVVMQRDYRRLAVFVDRPSEHKYLWVLLESSDDPAAWVDLETAGAACDSWIEAYEAGTRALMSYVGDPKSGPVRADETDGAAGD